MIFQDRADAGRQLAGRLGRYASRDDVIVLGLPRGGVPVAFEVARALGADLDVLVVRKLGVPGHEELAMGAIASGGAVWLNEEVIELAGVTPPDVHRVREQELAELRRRERLFRAGRPPVAVTGKVAIVVDDGMATGATLHAGLLALRVLKPARIVAAVPVAPDDAAARLAGAMDEFVCVAQPPDFRAVGQFYRDFRQTTDTEVRELLARAQAVTS